MSRTKEEIQNDIELEQNVIDHLNAKLIKKLEENEEWKRNKESSSHSINIVGGTFYNSQVGDNSVPPNSPSSIQNIKNLIDQHTRELARLESELRNSN